MEYRHTQVGYRALAVLLMLAAVIATIARSPTLFGVQCLLMVVSFAFVGSLTTAVNDQGVSVRFGPLGTFIRERFAFGDILTARAVRNSPAHGWGIRYIHRGRLWNVWGLDAVELQLKNGTRFRIGTDEPEALLNALRQSGVNV